MVFLTTHFVALSMTITSCSATRCCQSITQAAARGLVCSSNLPIVPESAVFVYSSYYPLRGLIVNRNRWEQYKKHIPVTVMKCSLKNWARVRRRNEKKHYQTFCYQSFCSEFQTVLCLRHCGLRSYILFVKKSRLQSCTCI